MMAGRRPKLTYIDLRRVDAWWRCRSKSVKVMAYEMRINHRTLYDAALRRRAYAGCR